MEHFSRPSPFWAKYSFVAFMLAWMGLYVAVRGLFGMKGNPPDWVFVVYLIGGFFVFVQFMKIIIRKTHQS